ncbi:AHH domain-containing protein [Desulfonema magnum]|uniref:AHH domain-containing protein n=1 Tax=Desulfonema magnum TaxID=45655 RepID=A0A975BHG6_9BACT|nr:AHH domain-containing protein [Desulfonema magnum]QTA85819.1 AHH domain-containing protein [Desulfonema magnum]
MSESGEKISLGLPAVDEDKCPICNKKKHKDTTKEKKEGNGELSSIPSNLGCKTIPQHQDIAYYATAAHHLIPAMQCLAKFHRLSQMADEVGYDVNNKNNGLSLPTVGQLNENSYYLQGYQYGELVPVDKKEVAFEVMRHVDSLPSTSAFGSQWHVGHHDWSFETAKKLINDTDDISHNDTNYEEKVNKLLRDIEAKLSKDKTVCEPDDKGEIGREVLKRLDGISSKIRSNVKGWKGYYVSSMSYVYAKEER